MRSSLPLTITYRMTDRGRLLALSVHSNALTRVASQATFGRPISKDT